MTTTTTIFPQKPADPKKGILPQHLCPKSVRQDVEKIRRRVKTLRRLASIAARHPEDITSDTSPNGALWSDFNTLVPIRTDLSPPPKDFASLGIIHREDLVAGDDAPPSQLQTTFKGLRRVIRILIRHACKLRRVRYGKAMLRMFVKKPSVTLKSILRTSEGAADAPSLPTDLFVLWDETTGQIITAPEGVIAKITLMEIVALSPDPTLPPGPLFPG